MALYDFFPYRADNTIAERLRQEMASVSIAVGSRSGICFQLTQTLAQTLATASYRNQEGADDIRCNGHAEEFWIVRDRLQASSGVGERQIRRVAEGDIESVWSEA